MLAYQQSTFSTIPTNDQWRLPSNEVLGQMSDRVEEQETILPLLIEIDERLKELSAHLRRRIDASSLKNPSLAQLLHLNKLNVKFTAINVKLTGAMNAHLMEVLKLRSRAAEIDGIELSGKMKSEVEEMLQLLEEM